MKFKATAHKEKDDQYIVELSQSEIYAIAGLVQIGLANLQSGYTSADLRAAYKFVNLTGRAIIDGEPNNNPERSRYYGLRIGDLVEPAGIQKGSKSGEVVGFAFLDNNRVEVVWDGASKASPEVAEWLKITKKLEDRL